MTGWHRYCVGGNHHYHGNYVIWVWPYVPLAGRHHQIRPSATFSDFLCDNHHRGHLKVTLPDHVSRHVYPNNSMEQTFIQGVANTTVRNYAYEYDMNSPKVKWNLNANHTKWHVCIFHWNGFLLLYYRSYIQSILYLWKMQNISQPLYSTKSTVSIIEKIFSHIFDENCLVQTEIRQHHWRQRITCLSMQLFKSNLI